MRERYEREMRESGEMRERYVGLDGKMGWVKTKLPNGKSPQATLLEGQILGTLTDLSDVRLEE